jgi:hypothetical protein
MIVIGSHVPTSENPAIVWYRIPRRLFSKLWKSMPKKETDDNIYVRFGRDLEAREIISDHVMQRIWAEQDGKKGRENVLISFEA